MKTKLFLLAMMLIVLVSGKLFAQKTEDIISVYPGSHVAYDDKLGYDIFYVCTGKDSEGKMKIDTIEGYIHHRFCYFPKGCSALQIIKNYEEAISNYGGTVLHSANTKECINAFMKKGNPSRTSRNFEYQLFRDRAYKYFSAKIPSDTLDYYVMIVMANCGGKAVYSLVTVKTKPMETGMVSIENIHDGMSTKGHIAIYNIFFDTGKSDVKEQSNEALKTIAEYMKTHPDKNYYVVGHTDNVGDYEMNMQLSTDRARALVNVLVSDHGINIKQLKAYGVGPLSPVKSNKDDKGKAKNRRVEIVEQ